MSARLRAANATVVGLPGRVVVAALCASTVGVPAAHPVHGVALDRSARAAGATGQTDAVLSAFHARYQLDAGGAVRSLEIFTPFRLAVLEAQRRAAERGTVPSLGRLQRTIAAPDDQLTVRAVVTLHPLHTYVRPPAYTIVLVDGSQRRPADLTQRVALGPRGLPIPSVATGGEVSMAAVEIEATFSDVPRDERDAMLVAVFDPNGQPILIHALPPGLR